jgi:predicted TIM-barrel fold metal-dependent hydrolase
MTAELDLTSFRFVDSHMHHWDPANTEWYPHLDPDFDLADLGIAGAEGMRRRYLVDEYLTEAGPWQLDKYVHVNATGGPKAYLAEAEWLAGLGGHLTGVIGTVDLEQDPAEVLAELKAQAEHPLFRGIRNMHIPDHRSPAFDAALGFLSERGLVYDFLVHPATMAEGPGRSSSRRTPRVHVISRWLCWRPRSSRRPIRSTASPTSCTAMTPRSSVRSTGTSTACRS